VAIQLPVGADDKPAKVNHLRRFLFWATGFGDRQPPRYILMVKKTRPLAVF
jgi:hypothetical protein